MFRYFAPLNTLSITFYISGFFFLEFVNTINQTIIALFGLWQKSLAHQCIYEYKANMFSINNFMCSNFLFIHCLNDGLRYHAHYVFWQHPMYVCSQTKQLQNLFRLYSNIFLRIHLFIFQMNSKTKIINEKYIAWTSIPCISYKRHNFCLYIYIPLNARHNPFHFVNFA